MSAPKLILPPNPDAAAFHLIRSEAGYVYTPWFSYEDNGSHGFSNQSQYAYHRVRRSAVDSFAMILGINAFDVTITERVDSDMSDPMGDHRMFKLGTRIPVIWPKVGP